MIIIKVDHARCKRMFRLLYRAALAIAVSLLFLSGGWIGWRSLRDRILIPRLGKYLASQAEQCFGWRLTYESISGNLLTTPPPIMESAPLAAPPPAASHPPPAHPPRTPRPPRPPPGAGLEDPHPQPQTLRPGGRGGGGQKV